MFCLMCTAQCQCKVTSTLLSFIHSFILLLVEEKTMTILHNPQIAELIEAGCAFKSDVIISKNETKEIKEKKKEISEQLQ